MSKLLIPMESVNRVMIVSINNEFYQLDYKEWYSVL